MSTLKANNVRHTSSTVDNLALDSSGNVSVYGVGDVATALAAKAPTASPTFTGNVVWSGATLRADSNEVTTGQSTTSTSYTDLATVGPAVTVTTGTKALVIISTWMRNNTAGANVHASFAVSGATTRAASDNDDLFIKAVNNSTPALRASAAYIVEGLTAGSNTFTMKYKVSSGSADYEQRQISVIDMGS